MNVLSLDDEKEMSDDREHLTKRRSTLDTKPRTNHLRLLKRWIFVLWR